MPRYLLILLVLLPVTIFAQPGANPYTARIVISRGGFVDFVFNSVEKYQTGITYNDYTYIDICFHDPDNPGVGGTKWQLEVETATAGVNLIGASAIPLSVIELELNGTATATYPGGAVVLTSAAQLIATNGIQGDESDNKIRITYRCGVTNSLLGYPPAYNTVDLIFTLSEQP